MGAQQLQQQQAGKGGGSARRPPGKWGMTWDGRATHYPNPPALTDLNDESCRICWQGVRGVILPPPSVPASPRLCNIATSLKDLTNHRHKGHCAVVLDPTTTIIIYYDVHQSYTMSYNVSQKQSNACSSACLVQGTRVLPSLKSGNCLQGEMLCCETCPAVMHAQCAGLPQVPGGDWHCPSCTCSACGHAAVDPAAEAPLLQVGHLPLPVDKVHTPLAARQCYICHLVRATG